MKLSKQVMTLVEANEGALTEDHLKKFWKDIKANVFEESRNVIKNDLGLFYDGTEMGFHGLSVEGKELPKDFYRNPEKYVSPKFVSQNPRDIISIILNDYTFDDGSTEGQDEQAFEYFLKHLKGEEVFFYGSEEVKADGLVFDVEYTGKIKVKNFKYEANSETLSVTDFVITELKIK